MMMNIANDDGISSINYCEGIAPDSEWAWNAG